MPRIGIGIWDRERAFALPAKAMQRGDDADLVFRKQLMQAAQFLAAADEKFLAGGERSAHRRLLGQQGKIQSRGDGLVELGELVGQILRPQRGIAARVCREPGKPLFDIER